MFESEGNFDGTWQSFWVKSLLPLPVTGKYFWIQHPNLLLQKVPSFSLENNFILACLRPIHPTILLPRISFSFISTVYYFQRYSTFISIGLYFYFNSTVIWAGQANPFEGKVCIQSNFTFNLKTRFCATENKLESF